MNKGIRKISSILAAALSLGLLAGCASIPDGDAEVSDRQFVAAHEESYTQMVGKVMIPQTRDVPDSWYVYLVQGDERSKLQVTDELFDYIQVGSTVCVEDGLITKLSSCDADR